MLKIAVFSGLKWFIFTQYSCEIVALGEKYIFVWWLTQEKWFLTFWFVVESQVKNFSPLMCDKDALLMQTVKDTISTGW